MRFVVCCLKVAVCGFRLVAVVDDDVFRLRSVLPSVYSTFVHRTSKPVASQTCPLKTLSQKQRQVYSIAVVILLLVADVNLFVCCWRV